jgi:protein-tyrosine phosphatase
MPKNPNPESPTPSPRVVPLEGCLNFRDLGGYPTGDGRSLRWGRLFRSDALHHLTPADIDCLRGQIGLGTVIDLRSSAEVRSEGRGRLEHEPFAFHHIPLFDGEQQSRERPPQESLADIYFMLSQFAREPIARVVRVLAESEAPAVYHCAAGKDRTGVISAILLGLLGVEDEIIVADYALTGANIDAIIARLNAAEGYRTMLAALPPETMHALPETMDGFLRRLRQAHGSVEGYARDAGLDDAIIERLRASLLS